MKFILAKKLDMTQVFDENGNVHPVTVIEAGPCSVCQIKTKEKDGYEAIQLGLEKIQKQQKITKTMVKKPFRHIKEFRGKTEELKMGDEVKVSIFSPGDKVIVSGISKGKGFAGAVKRWGFRDFARAHGIKDSRRLGSVGCRFPQRVIKGKKMPGRMGGERTTVKNLKVIKVDSENNLLALEGAIPGPRGTLLEVKGK